ncbi:tetratricopeptide repeat protein [Hirschia maritima]|uniref:tetratricopeptide repeat protein n=1 Tax=Hirschia maritima TaxID=1121961 RepID=UPI00036A39BA|nr:tetratricopeptide repeat protein [Hirschia maritima]
MSDIFDEVEENVKADKLNKFWDKAWPFALGGSIAIIAMVGANSYFEDRAKKENETNGRAFELGLKSLEAQDLASAREKFGELLDKDTGFASLAAQHLAQAELEMAGDTEAAAKALEVSAQGEGALADLAKLKAAYFLADTKSLAEVEAALGSLVENTGSFGALARELVAAKAFEEGDLERARSEYQALTLRLNTPQGVQQRANEALAVLPVNTASNEVEDSLPAEETSAETAVEDPA